MIEVSQLNGRKYWINPHLIEKIEMHPDVTVTMISGTMYVVKEPPEVITTRIVEYRKQIGGFRNEV